jgi:hypothetical protein
VQLTLSGGFGRAAEKLADTVRHVIDLGAGPERVRAKKIAEAEGQGAAMVILAEAQAKAMDIEARAATRVQKLQVRRQENIESIMEKAVDALPPPEQVSDQPVEQDWVSRFFRECQDISDEQMQLIWARILAGEVAQPRSFSPRTLSIVRDLTKYDAETFAKLCSFTWFIPGTEYVPIIHDDELEHVVEAELHFPVLIHLTSIGLIEFNKGGYITPTTSTEIAPSYFGRVHELKSDGGEERVLALGQVVFTVAGAELARISNAERNDRYEEAALGVWGVTGWKEAWQGTDETIIATSNSG